MSSAAPTLLEAKPPGELARLALIVVLFVLSLACTSQSSGQTLVSPSSERPGLPAQGSAADFDLVDQDGQEVRLSQFRSRVVLMTFFYSQCPDADFCPIINLNLKQVRDALDETSRKQVVLLSITLDPLADTPEELKKYATERGFYGPGWYFLTGAPEQIAEVTQAYDVPREEVGPRSHTHSDGTMHEHNREFKHLAQVLLVNQKGEVRGAYLGVPVGEGRILSVGEIAEDIRWLLTQSGGS